MTPLYRALCEAALSEYGVLEPSVSTTGVFRDELGDLLQAGDGPALILQALAFADAATGATIGREARVFEGSVIGHDVTISPGAVLEAGSRMGAQAPIERRQASGPLAGL